METIDRSALVHYTPEEMFALVNDVASYPEFLPWCSGSEVLSESADELTARIDFSVGGVSKSFTTHNNNTPFSGIVISLVEGPFSSLEGNWRFDPLGDAGCRIALSMQYGFSSKMVAMVVGPVFGKIANSLVDAFMHRAVEVYGKR